MHLKSRNVWSLVALAALLAGSLPLGRASAQVGSPLPTHAPMPTPVPSPILPIVPTVAPGYQAPMVIPTSATIAGVTQQPFVGLSLQDAIGMALLKNPNLSISASNSRVAGYQVVEAKGAFDLQAAGTAGVEHADFTLRKSVRSGAGRREDIRLSSESNPACPPLGS